MPRQGRVNPPEPVVDTLHRFLHRVDELLKTRLMREQNLNSALTARGRPGEYEITFRNPNDDDLRSFLMVFRPFILKREPIFVDHVANVSHRHITPDGLVDELKRVRAEWREAIDTGNSYVLMQDAPTLTPPEVMDLWINGYFFHFDRAKERRLEELRGDDGLTRWMLVSALEGSTRCILGLGRLVRVALREGLVSATPVRGKAPRGKAP